VLQVANPLGFEAGQIAAAILAPAQTTSVNERVELRVRMMMLAV